jgi:hypothetical protein
MLPILQEIYFRMYLIRSSELKICELYHSDEMKTPMHMSMGQEAAPAAISLALGVKSKIISTYRSHAPFLAHTKQVNKFFCELFGKDNDPLGYIYKFLLNFTKNGFLPLYIPELAHAGRSHPNNLTTKNRFYDFIQYNWLLKRKQYIYFFAIIFGIKKHIFIDGNFQTIKHLSFFERILLPLTLLKIYVFEVPKTIFRKFKRVIFLKLD